MVLAERTAVVRHLWPLLTVQEIGRSVEFYCDRLGFAIVGRAESDGKLFWCRLERDGALIMLQQAEDEDGSTARCGLGVVFYFVCDDADIMYDELCSRGLQLMPPKVASYGMKQIFVEEPDGYSICFESVTEAWRG